MGIFSSCDHNYRGHKRDMYKYAEHKCVKCGKKERCTGRYNIHRSGGAEWECTVCGQEVSYTKSARD